MPTICWVIVIVVSLAAVVLVLGYLYIRYLIAFWPQ